MSRFNYCTGTEKKTRCPFWMVYVDGEPSPKYMHRTEAEAVDEAERLARLTGKDVFVLQAYQWVRATSPTPPVQWKPTVSYNR